MSKAKQSTSKTVDAITHDEARRKNIPTAEYQSMVEEEEQVYIKVAYERRNKDLDPQLVWRGKDVTDWSDLVVQAPPLYIQEKVHPKVLIDELMRQSKEQDYASGKIMADLFADFNGLPNNVDKTEFYQHDQHWTNRMILGDSLQVMASLVEREGLRGQVQCIYFDPPYGIKFNSNFQWSTTSRDVKDGKIDHITREPEQVKAFRDTWKDGIHSYLTYLRDRLTVARDLLKESGSIFVQIGDENVHRVRSLMDEVFGDANFISLIKFKTTGGRGSELLDKVTNYIVWYCKNPDFVKYRKLLQTKTTDELEDFDWVALKDGTFSKVTIENRREGKNYMLTDFTSQGSGDPEEKFVFQNEIYFARGGRHWTTNSNGRELLVKAGRVQKKGANIFYRKYYDDYSVQVLGDLWLDTAMGGFKKNQEKIYVVQTPTKVIERCLLLSSDPGDLVLDPTCGGGTTAFAAEQWGRRWITIDTSRVALALTRARIMGAKYPYYILSDSKEGQLKEAEISQKTPSIIPVSNNVSHGFIYSRVPHITLKSVAYDSEIEVIWQRCKKEMDIVRSQLNALLDEKWEEWELPREAKDKWLDDAKILHEKWWKAYIARQNEINTSISAKAEYEYLYEKPYEDKNKVRVAGPFTVESISPHRTLIVGETDEFIDLREQNNEEDFKSFAEMILENLKTAGIQQAQKSDKINFSSLMPWPGTMICADGRYVEGDFEKKRPFL